MHRSVRQRPLPALFALFAVALTVVMTACGGAGAPSQTDPFSGMFGASGGGGALAQVQALTKRFSELHPRVRWDVENVGSDAAMPLVTTKQADIGFISRDPTVEEKATVALLSLGITGTGLAVNATNPVTGLTLEQVRGIYTGKIKDWSEVGGKSEPIKVMVREVNAATRQNFEEAVFKGAKPAYVTGIITAGSGNEMVDYLSGFAGGIGLVTVKDVRAVDPRIRLLSLDGVAPTKENVDNGTFPIRRPLFLIYPKDASQLKPAMAAFIEFVRSPEGQKVLAGF